MKSEIYFGACSFRKIPAKKNKYEVSAVIIVNQFTQRKITVNTKMFKTKKGNEKRNIKCRNANNKHENNSQD